MPITATCSGCGKHLKVRDELVGKKLKCPGCGVTFIASAKPADLMPRAGAAKPSKGPAVTISSTLIIGVSVAVLVLGGILAFVFGPLAVWHQWEALGSEPNNAVNEVVSLGLQAYLSERGSWNPRKPGHMPRTNDDTVFVRALAMSMPATIPFNGTTSEGNFKGVFHPKTGEVEADVSVGGTNLGGITTKDGSTKIHVTGRMKAGQPTAEVDGHEAKLHYPPQTDDEK